jgi:hypothetical protein
MICYVYTFILNNNALDAILSMTGNVIFRTLIIVSAIIILIIFYTTFHSKCNLIQNILFVIVFYLFYHLIAYTYNYDQKWQYNLYPRLTKQTINDAIVKRNEAICKKLIKTKYSGLYDSVHYGKTDIRYNYPNVVINTCITSVRAIKRKNDNECYILPWI